MRGRHCSHRCAQGGVHEREALFSPLCTYGRMGGTLRIVTVSHPWEKGDLSAQHASLSSQRMEASLRNIPPYYTSGWCIYPGCTSQGGIYPGCTSQGGVPASLHTSGWCTCLPTYLRGWYIPQGVPQGVVYTSGCTSGWYMSPFLPVCRWVQASLSPFSPVSLLVGTVLYVHGAHLGRYEAQGGLFLTVIPVSLLGRKRGLFLTRFTVGQEESLPEGCYSLFLPKDEVSQGGLFPVLHRKVGLPGWFIPVLHRKGGLPGWFMSCFMPKRRSPWVVLCLFYGLPGMILPLPGRLFLSRTAQTPTQESGKQGKLSERCKTCSIPIWSENNSVYESDAPCAHVLSVAGFLAIILRFLAVPRFILRWSQPGYSPGFSRWWNNCSGYTVRHGNRECCCLWGLGGPVTGLWARMSRRPTVPTVKRE